MSCCCISSIDDWLMSKRDLGNHCRRTHESRLPLLISLSVKHSHTNLKLRNSKFFAFETILYFITIPRFIAHDTSVSLKYLLMCIASTHLLRARVPECSFTMHTKLFVVAMVHLSIKWGSSIVHSIIIDLHSYLRVNWDNFWRVWVIWVT